MTERAWLVMAFARIKLSLFGGGFKVGYGQTQILTRNASENGAVSRACKNRAALPAQLIFPGCRLARFGRGKLAD